ncbi:putative acetyltransferase [compost metagenome]
MKEQYNNNLIPEAETAGNEFYIDSIAVAPIARGKGIGTQLLQYAITHAKQHGFKQVGLLVDLKNPNAQKLYERIGFKLGKKTPFAGGEYYHMYISLD